MMTGCADQMNIEDVSLTFILGLDLDEDDNLLLTMSTPVFSKEAKIPRDRIAVKTVTVRDSREKFDTTVIGATSGSKTQIVLVGKRLLKRKKWIHYLDPFYRDPKNTVTTRVVAVDGPVKDLVFYNPKDKPRLPVYLTKLIDKASQRNITVKTSLQELHEQLTDKGMTASITAMKKTNRVWLTGSVLLDEQGKYKLTITPHENKLMRILQHEKKGEFPFTIAIPPQSHDQGKRWLSFITQGMKVKTKVRYDHRFIFDVNINMRIAITERLFPFDVKKDIAKLQKGIETKLQADFERFIKKIQAAEIDPVGFGLYARAYAYPKWKKVQKRWGKAFSKADVNVKVTVKIGGMGTIK